MYQLTPVTPANPLRQARLEARLSLDQLARKANVSRQLIIRAEQGVYADPPPRLLDVIMDLAAVEVLFGGDREVVYHVYHAFQTATRKANFDRLSKTFDFRSVPVGVHPFVDWRLRSGIRARIGPAKYYCVHPALLHKYEVQPHLVQSTPGDLQRALRESGYSSELLDALEDAYYTYKVSRRITSAQ